MKDYYIKRDQWKEYMAYKAARRNAQCLQVQRERRFPAGQEEHRLEMDPIFAFAHEVLPQFVNNILHMPMLYATYLGWSKL